MRMVLAKRVCDSMENECSAQKAAERAITMISKRLSGVYSEMGLLAIDVHGRIGAVHGSPNLTWAYMTPKLHGPVASLTAKFVSNLAVEPPKPKSEKTDIKR